MAASEIITKGFKEGPSCRIVQKSTDFYFYKLLCSCWVEWLRHFYVEERQSLNRVFFFFLVEAYRWDGTIISPRHEANHGKKKKSLSDKPVGGYGSEPETRPA